MMLACRGKCPICLRPSSLPILFVLMTCFARSKGGGLPRCLVVDRLQLLPIVIQIPVQSRMTRVGKMD
jgi:hypothetical protein